MFFRTKLHQHHTQTLTTVCFQQGSYMDFYIDVFSLFAKGLSYVEWNREAEGYLSAGWQVGEDGYL